MRYCISVEEVEMSMWDLQDDWKIPVITKEMPTGKEVEEGSSKTHARDNIVPKISGESQSEVGKKGSDPKKDAQIEVSDTSTQERTTGGSRKKAKAHKQLPEYTITEDDIDLVAKRVQDCVAEEFEEAQHQ
jgi:hypothetical protein